MCCISLSRFSFLEETVFALCAKVLYTLFGCYVVIAVPVKILVCMGWFSVGCCAEGVDGFYGDQSV